jgi:hypothetical protein
MCVSLMNFIASQSRSLRNLVAHVKVELFSNRRIQLLEFLLQSSRLLLYQR